jgi:hypothetical protein
VNKVIRPIRRRLQLPPAILDSRGAPEKFQKETIEGKGGKRSKEKASKASKAETTFI